MGACGYCRTVAGEGLGRSPNVLARKRDDLRAVLLYERDRPDQALTEALLAKRSALEPSPVRDAADRLLRLHAPWVLDLAGAAEALIGAAGDERSRRLFVARSLRPDGPSPGDLAGQEGVSAERIRQIVQSAGRRVRDALTATPGPLQWAVRTMRDRLGSVTTGEGLAATLAILGASTEPAVELVPWLAGPYLPVPRRPGWMAVQPREAVSRTAACLAADGGVRRMTDVESELADLGVRADQLVAWLSASGAAVVHDLAVLVVDGHVTDAAERLLDAHGVPRTFGELVADFAAGAQIVDEGALATALRNRRFSRTANGAVGLAAWGAEEESRHANKQHGRPRPTRPVQPGRPDTPARRRSPSASDRLWLWVKIDDEALRGSEADVPVALVEGLGLEPPGRRTFSSRWGPLSLAYEGAQPTRGSVRAVALAAGARVDDTLLLGFSVAGDVAVEVRPAVAPGSSPGESATGFVFSPEIANGGTR